MSKQMNLPKVNFLALESLTDSFAMLMSFHQARFSSKSKLSILDSSWECLINFLSHLRGVDITVEGGHKKTIVWRVISKLAQSVSYLTLV